LQQNLGNSKIASFSVCHIKKLDRAIIKSSEFHNYCNETIIPMNGDILMHFAPASDKDILQTDQIEVFRIPALTLVTVRPGVWHHIPFTHTCDSADILVVLPERTYINDCHLYMFPENEFIEVTQ
jgi:ureidoglycolate lyase